MVGGIEGWRWLRGGGPWGIEGADAKMHHERYGWEKMRGEGGAMLTERVLAYLVV